MSKRKIFTLALSVMMIAILAVGGTLAYFMDTDSAENVFTTGNVEIDLQETFDPDNAKLIPGVKIEKKVEVQNIGSEDSFVRVHIAFPAILDSGNEDQPEFAAYNNTLHWNFTNASLADGQWNWGTSKDAANYPGNGGEWNFYQAEIDGILYNVYVATYETALKKDETTANEAIYQVYLDTKVTNEGMTEILGELGEIKVLVFAEGGQVATFEDEPFVALNTQFGDPMAAGYVAPWNQ